jgi:hypothetical protein
MRPVAERPLDALASLSASSRSTLRGRYYYIGVNKKFQGIACGSSAECSGEGS